ncbi:hypothetical protein LTR91_017712 [Friedmanniomyces endolithicus]|uniref:AB hydrolase-1 domain-containing protein n=1 Tax=Friedmanniomyces endolithicus TaxID=329885 RepID=A0AAN6K5M5_9PEZI|nr:hypothetical protein LTR91_017712 [Friedmanniomyces endolithicus]
MYVEDSPTVDSSVDVDSERSPQLNKVICRCRCGCACASSRDGNDMNCDGGGQSMDTARYMSCTTDNTESDDGGSDEDAKDDVVEIGDFGLVSIRAIHMALAKQNRCTCHGSVLSESEVYTFSTRSPLDGSGFLPDNSLIVEVGSNSEHSTTMSTSSLGFAAYNSSPGDIVGFMGGQFELLLPHPVPQDLFVLEANNITINYRLDAPSTPHDLVVLINGLADDLSTWDYQIPALLKAGYRVLRYDNRGIGKTSRPHGPYTSELLADDLHALLNALDFHEGFHLLGVSMGGMIAQSYALRYPNPHNAKTGRRLLSLSLCCTYAQPTTFCSRMFALWAEMAQRMSVQAVMRDVTLWAFTVPFFRTREDELREVEEAMEKLDMGVPEYLAQLTVIQKFDTTFALEGLRADERVLGGLEEASRVMVLAGKVDILIPVQLSRELAERIEGCQFLTTKGGHACMWEFPEEFDKTMLRFLDEHRESKP